MRIVFMGSPQFAADILQEIAECFDVIAVYTQPDRVRGRGKTLVPTPVKALAQSLGIEVHTPPSLKDENVIAELKELSPDVICVAAYGAILPQSVLDIPPLGCINVHASLLPRWRGAAPVERAIIAGDKFIGVSIMRMEEGLDTGDYCVVRKIELGDRNTEEATSELSLLGAQALVTALNLIEKGAVKWTPQNSDEATYADKIQKGELNLHPSNSAVQNLRLVKASTPSHSSKIKLNDKDIAVESAIAVDDAIQLQLDEILGSQNPEGTAISLHKRLFLGCSDGFIEIKQLKPAGKNSMDATSFLRGTNLPQIAEWCSA